MPFATGKLLRWNHFGRKNLGFLHAISQGARWVYDTDDDNELQSMVNGIPLPRPNALVEEVSTSLPLYNLYPQMSTNPSSWPRETPAAGPPSLPPSFFPPSCDSSLRSSSQIYSGDVPLPLPPKPPPHLHLTSTSPLLHSTPLHPTPPHSTPLPSPPLHSTPLHQADSLSRRSRTIGRTRRGLHARPGQHDASASSSRLPTMTLTSTASTG